jgi:hypothetical protein
MIGDTEDQLAKSVGNGRWKLRGKLVTLGLDGLTVVGPVSSLESRQRGTDTVV